MTDEARRAIEAILMVAEEPVPAQLLAQLVELPTGEVEALLGELRAAYEAEGRGFVLVEVAGGHRFQSHPELAPYVERFVLEGQVARLSGAALETLAIVAYKQPISRAQVAAIRGVNVDGVVRTLEQRGYIAEVARDPGPGNAVLFGTTATFLEKLGLAGLEDLPPIAQFVPGADVVEQLEQGLRAEAAAPPVEPAGQDEVPAAEEHVAGEPPVGEGAVEAPAAQEPAPAEAVTGPSPAGAGAAAEPPAAPDGAVDPAPGGDDEPTTEAGDDPSR